MFYQDPEHFTSDPRTQYKWKKQKDVYVTKELNEVDSYLSF